MHMSAYGAAPLRPVPGDGCWIGRSGGSCGDRRGSFGCIDHGKIPVDEI